MKKVAVSRKRRIPRKGIIMTLVAFGVLGGLFFALSQRTEPKQSNLLGEHTYIAQDGGDNSGPGGGQDSDRTSGEPENENEVEHAGTTETPKPTETEIETEHETPEPTKRTEPTKVRPSEALRQREPSRKPSVTLSISPTRIPKDERTGPGNVIPTLQEQKRELRLNEGKGILLNKEPQKTEIKFENVNGKVEVKKKAEEGTDQSVSESEATAALKEIDEQLEIKPEKDDTLAISRGDVTARTKLKLTMSADTGKLGVEVLGETKDINVLPDQAVNTLKSSSVIDEVSDDASVTLGLSDNQPSFQIEGKKTKKILGLIPVQISKKVVVSADTGSIISEDTSTLDKILSIISL